MGGLADLTLPLFSTMENMANGNGFSTGRGGGQGPGSDNDFTGHGLPTPTS